MFPTSTSVIITNADGEVTGWDNPAYADEPDAYYERDDYDPFDFPEDEDENRCPSCHAFGSEPCDPECGEDDGWVAEDAWLDGSYEE